MKTQESVNENSLSDKVACPNENDLQVETAKGDHKDTEKNPWKKFQLWTIYVYERSNNVNRERNLNCLSLRVFRTVCLFFSLSTCVFLIVQTIRDYYKYEVNTKIRDIYHDNLTFPVVSICNVNPMGTPKAAEFISNYYANHYGVNVSLPNQFIELLRNQTISNENEFIFYSTYDKNFNSSLRDEFSFKTIFLCLMHDSHCNHTRDFQT